MASKKDKKLQKKTDDWNKEDELSGAIADRLKIEDESESDDDDVSDFNQPPKRSAFALLAEDDDAAEESDDSAKPAESEVLQPAKAQPAKKDQKKKKEKQVKKKAEADGGDDLDKLLEEIEKAEPKEAKGKKKKGKANEVTDQPAQPTSADAVEATKVDEAKGDNEPEVQSAAGAKPEAASKKKKDKGKKQATDASNAEAKEAGAADAVPGAVEAKASEGSENDEETVEDGGKKKKKKKKTKEEREKEKAEKKKPTKIGAVMREALKKLEEEKEKERLKIEEEERKQREQEEKYLDKARKEEERKKKKKDKEKERIARQKAEGRYMTAEQKLKMERGKQMVEMLKQQQGMVIPEKGKDDNEGNSQPTKRAPVKYVDRRKMQKKQQQQQKDDNGSKEESPEAEAAENDSWEKVEHEDLLDSWDKVHAGPEEKPEKISSETIKISPVPKSESEESSDEESEEDSSEEESEEESSSEAEEIPQHETKEQMRARIFERFKKRHEIAQAKKTEDKLRSPIVVVMGHVDTGKTKILDNIRRTHVQDSEAGGITQQIGATRIPADAIAERTKMVKKFDGSKMKIPGLLVIDTPGHESFRNLRSRGSSLCDIAILVVDIMHGLEPQTLESIGMLRERKTPFIVALNKIDRLFEWKRNPMKDIRDVLKSQQQNCLLEFKERLDIVKLQFAEQGLNTALFWENKNPEEYISLVPTSAHSGEGMGNLMAEVIEHSEKFLAKKLAYVEELDCSVLEVKQLVGLGHTIDVILMNGTLRVGDTIVVAGTEGPIVTQIRELLMPQPLKELRVKNPYEHYKELQGAQGIKILAKDLEKALAGLPLFVAQKEDEVEVLKDEMAKHLKDVLQSIKLSEHGVYVQASTLGSLEALLDFLKTSKIPYSGINVGPVHKKDVTRASTMLEHEDGQYAMILAFDVTVDRDAQEMADQLGVRIFTADIIYHLFDAFTKHRTEWFEKKRQENANLAVYPCKLRILPQYVFNARNPIVLGVVVEAGIVRRGTPICVPSKEFLFLGAVGSVEMNNKQLDFARAGQEVAVKIEHTGGDAPKMFGRHFDEKDILVSKISRESIDVCKKYFREELNKSDWQLMVELKKVFGIL